VPPLSPSVKLSVYVLLVQLVVVMMSPSGNAYMGRQVPQRDEEFNQIQIVLKYIFDVNTVTEMKTTFRCPL